MRKILPLLSFLCLSCQESYLDKLQQLDQEGRQISVQISPIPEKEGEIVPTHLTDDYVTCKSVVELEGTSFDAAGVEKVEVRSGEGPWQLAQGKEYWKASLELSLGKNPIQARVTGRNGKTALSGIIYVNWLWEEKALLPEPVFGSAVISYNGEIYVAGGHNEKKISDIFFKYNPENNQIQLLERLDYSSGKGNFFENNGNLYLVSGANKEILFGYQEYVYGINKLQVYDIVQNFWHSQDIPFSVFSFSSGKVGNSYYAISGIIDSINVIGDPSMQTMTLSYNTWEYEIISNTWTQRNIHDEYLGGLSFIEEHNINIIGPNKELFLYNTVDNSSSIIPDIFCYERFEVGGSQRIGNDVVILGGSSKDDLMDEIEYLRINDLKSKPLRKMPFKLNYLNVSSYNGNILLLGGFKSSKNTFNFSPLKHIYVYHYKLDSLY